MRAGSVGGRGLMKVVDTQTHKGNNDNQFIILFLKVGVTYVTRKEKSITISTFQLTPRRTRKINQNINI